MELGRQAAGTQMAGSIVWCELHTSSCWLSDFPWPGTFWEYLLLATTITATSAHKTQCVGRALPETGTAGALQEEESLWGEPDNLCRVFGGPCKGTIPLTLTPQSDLRHFTILLWTCGLLSCWEREVCCLQHPVQLGHISASLRGFPRVCSWLEVNWAVSCSPPLCPCCHKDCSQSP